MENILAFIGEWGIIIIGFILIGVAYIGSILPALPGVPFATFSVLLLHFTLYTYNWYVLAIIILLTIIISFVDYVVPIWGTKKYGGSKAGVRGSTVGLILGALLSFFTSGIGIIALFAGPFIGAYVGEKYFANASNKVALRSAWGSLVGFLAGTIGKLIVVSIIAITYIYGVIKFL